MTNKKLKPIILLLFFGSLIFIGIYQINKSRNEEIEINQEYKTISSQISFSGVLTYLFTEYGESYLTIEDTFKIVIYRSRNYEYEKYSLCDFIQIGDYIIKKSDSDTIYIKRKYGTYYFVIGEFINEKKRNDKK